MGKSFSDPFTERIYHIMADYEAMVDDLDSELRENMDDLPKIIEYLNDICCSSPLGFALRRYLCTKFGEDEKGADGSVTFKLSDGRTVTVSDYNRAGYDITTDDVKEYTDVFMDICARYNASEVIDRQEARRLLKVTGECSRSKMFTIGFALHMNDEEMTRFLTKELADRTYDPRNPDEVIALFCQVYEEYNSYETYKRLTEEYAERAAETPVTDVPKANYAEQVVLSIKGIIKDEESLIRFLLDNRSNLGVHSGAAYDEFISLYELACEYATIQALSNSSYLSEYMGSTPEEIRKFSESYDRAIAIRPVANTEQLAKCILEMIPRATFESKKDGKEVVTNDFIPVHNGEGAKKSKKQKTTSLPKEITKNLLIKDRIDDLINKIKPVERKDLIFLKFFVFSQELIKKEEADGEKLNYSKEYNRFIKECNHMLTFCGMSPLYPPIRFDNLVLLSLVSRRPFEMFGLIVESSFMNEPYYGSDSEDCSDRG